MSTSIPARPPIAVVGVSALFPGSSDEVGFWRDILAGRDLIRDVPPSHWLIEDYYDPDPTAPDKTYARRGAFLDLTPFDPLAFGVPPSIVPATDTSQLLALIVAQRVLDEAAHGQFAAMDKDRISVILGVTSGQELLSSMVSRLQRPVWLKSLREAGVAERQAQEICDRIASHYVPWQESTFPGLLGNVVAGRIANRFDLGGTNCVTDAACASTFAAVSMAVDELYLGKSDLVITGGVDTLNDIFMFMCFSKTPALSPTGDCRPFADDADGTMLGEGLAMVALKRLADAEAAGDSIYAVLRGMGSASDGRATSVYAPRPEGQASALRRAYAAAGYGPETIELIEAHGTGTKAGDVAEFEGLKLAFGDVSGRPAPWCALGSIKSQIGHTKAAAGAAGLFKAVMALHHAALPPTIKVARPNPRLGVAQSPFYLNTRARPWIRGSDHPRRAGVSSFGFGGSNFHVTLEEYRGSAPHAPRLRVVASELIAMAADSPAALVDALRSVEIGGPGFLTWFARHTQEHCPRAGVARVALVASDEAMLRDKLASAASAIERSPDRGFVLPGGLCYGVGARAGKLAFLFPGQGSQYVGMGGALALAWPEARAAWDRAADLPMDRALQLHQVVFPPPAFDDTERAAHEQRLRETQWAQPALGAAALAQLGLLDALGLRPDVVAGHSFGEIVALHAAGVFDASAAIAIARRRGELMAEAAQTPGAMTAALAPLADVRAAIADVDQVVVANHNAPAQVVLAGPVAAIDRAEAALHARAIRCERLPVATAFHSPVVAGCSAAFAEFLGRVPFAPAALPVFANADAAPYPGDPVAMRALLARQLTSPVRFVEQIEAMYAAGVRTFVEVGPGPVLTGLVDRILAGKPMTAIALDGRDKEGVTAFHEALSRLFAAGCELDLAALWRSFRRTDDPRQVKHASHAIPICGANHGKPYPPAAGAAALPPPNAEPAPRPAEPAARSAEPAPLSAETRPSTTAPDWMAAYLQVQRETAEVHSAWQNTMTQAHLAFLQTVERSLVDLTGGTTARPMLDALPSAPTLPAPAPPPLTATAPTQAPAIASVPKPQPLLAPKPNVAAEPAATAAFDLKATLLAVVAEKTGYPADILKLDMALEADLGIDSIKRVEILAALSSRVPDLPDVKPAAVGKLRTLGAIIEFLERMLNPVPAGAPLPPAPAPVAPSAAAAPAPGPIAIAAPQRFVVEAVAQAACGLGAAALATNSTLWVTDDGAGVAAGLVDALQRRGVSAQRIATVPDDATSVIFLGGLRTAADPESAGRAVREAFAAARAMAGRCTQSGGLFVTVQDTGGDFGLSGSERAWLGGIAAVAKTTACEWPLASVKAIDIARGDRSPAAVADAIASELLEGGPELEVGLAADGRRITLQPVRSELPAAVALTLDEHSVVVASGGGRGITAACLVALAAQTRARFVLLGRTALVDEPIACQGTADDAALKQALLVAARASGQSPAPAELGQRASAILASREVRATLAAIEAAGGSARYVPVDVTDSTAVAGLLQNVRADWGPISALVHGAGVIRDRVIAEKSDQQFAVVFDTKVQGLRALLDATASDPLRLIALFSSAAARRGNPGQCDYAAANEVLNKVAALEARRRGQRCLVRSIGWGPWHGGMVTPDLGRHFTDAGVALIAIEAGSTAFVSEVQQAAGGSAEIVVATAPQLATAQPAAGTGASFGVVVNASSHPYLASHAIDSMPVLPMVLVLEWFARAAKAVRPDLEVISCHRVKVLHGIRLLHFFDGADRFIVSCRPVASNGTARMALELRSADRTLHYSAEVELAERMPPAAATPPAPTGLARYSGVIYGHALFHGPEFQVIRSVDGVSAQGAIGTLVGTRDRGWTGAWLTDAAALDGGLQLALLWSAHITGDRVLPTAIGSYHAYAPSPDAESVQCRLNSRLVDKLKTVCDLSFVGPQGMLVAELRGVELHRRPDAAPAIPGSTT